MTNSDADAVVVVAVATFGEEGVHERDEDAEEDTEVGRGKVCWEERLEERGFVMLDRRRNFNVFPPRASD